MKRLLTNQKGMSLVTSLVIGSVVSILGVSVVLLLNSVMGLSTRGDVITDADMATRAVRELLGHGNKCHGALRLNSSAAKVIFDPNNSPTSQVQRIYADGSILYQAGSRISPKLNLTGMRIQESSTPRRGASRVDGVDYLTYTVDLILQFEVDGHTIGGTTLNERSIGLNIATRAAEPRTIEYCQERNSFQQVCQQVGGNFSGGSFYRGPDPPAIYDNGIVQGGLEDTGGTPPPPAPGPLICGPEYCPNPLYISLCSSGAQMCAAAGCCIAGEPPPPPPPAPPPAPTPMSPSVDGHCSSALFSNFSGYECTAANVIGTCTGPTIGATPTRPVYTVEGFDSQGRPLCTCKLTY